MLGLGDLFGLGGCVSGDMGAVCGMSLQEQCARQTQTAAVRSLMRRGLLNPTLAYLMRNSVPPPPLDEPRRTLLAGRPWEDAQ